MKRVRFFFLLLGFLFLTNCNDSNFVADTLNHAEVLMNDYPDSAYIVLKTISPADMKQHHTRARYALLYTQAKDKNYIDETNDSLINVAVDYFRYTDNVRYKFLSYYYKGRVCFNSKDYLNATSCYMEAEQLADKVEDDYLVGLLYAELGRIYRLYYDYPKSLEAHQKAAECYERAGKNLHRNYMWLNQSSILRNMNEYEKAEHLLLRALEEAKEKQDETLIRLCLASLVMNSVDQSKMLIAKEFYQELKPFIDESYGSASFMGDLARIYMFERNIILAKKCLDEGWIRANTKTDSINLYLDSSDILYTLGEERTAYQLLMKGVSLQNDEAHQALQQPVLTAQRDLLLEKLDFEAFKLSMEKRLNLMSIFFFLFLFCIIIYLFVRYLKKHRKKTIQAINNLKEEKEQVEVEKERITSVLQQLDKDKKNADWTVVMLKEEIYRKEKESDVEISNLLGSLEDEKQSIKNLQQTLVQEEERYDEEKTVAYQTIQTLREVIVQKEENHKKLEVLIQKLEGESKLYMDTARRIGTELEFLQNENKKMMLQKVELLKNVLEHIAEFVFLHEAKYLKEETREKKVKEGITQLKKNYFAGGEEYRIVETLVNQYLGNVMYHFREEISLANESEYRRACYMFAGVSGPIIGQIMNESKDAVYQRKSRLIKKIGLLSCPHKEMFLQLLCK